MILDHLGCLNPFLNPLRAILATPKTQKSLENGPFGDQISVKNGSKMCFFERYSSTIWGCTNKWNKV